MTYTSYFKCAVWLPAILLPSLLVADATYTARPLTGGLEQYFLIYVLGFGLPAYLAFAAFATRVISLKPEQDVVRFAWRAPLAFIPFYGFPWVLYGLLCLMLGRPAGIGMTFMWIAYLPYVLIVGYVFAAASVFIYKLIRNKSDSRVG